MGQDGVQLRFSSSIGVGGQSRAISGGGGGGGGAILARGWKVAGDRLLRKALKGGTEALVRVADDLLGRAQALTPELTGALVRSGRVHRAERRFETMMVVSFGAEGPSSAYAFRVHEELKGGGEITQSKSSDDGKAGKKYLERPLRKHTKRYLQDIADGVRRGIAGG